MEVFIELKKYLGFLGIKPDKKLNFNAENFAIVTLLTFCLTMMSLHIVFESESLINSVNTFYAIASTAFNSVTLLSNVLKKSKIFELFKGFQEMIIKRKFLSISGILLDS